MELTQQEVFALIGEKDLRIAALVKHIASLEAKVRELTTANQSVAGVLGAKPGLDRSGHGDEAA